MLLWYFEGRGRGGGWFGEVYISYLGQKVTVFELWTGPKTNDSLLRLYMNSPPPMFRVSPKNTQSWGGKKIISLVSDKGKEKKNITASF